MRRVLHLARAESDSSHRTAILAPKTLRRGRVDVERRPNAVKARPVYVCIIVLLLRIATHRSFTSINPLNAARQVNS